MSLLVLFRGTGGEADVVSLPIVAHICRAARRCFADANLYVPAKDPVDIVDFEIDWSRLLGEDTIASSRWGIPAGITGVSGSNTTTTTTVWLSGGTAGTDYGVLNRITTSDGRVIDRTMVVPVRDC